MRWYLNLQLDGVSRLLNINGCYICCFMMAIGFVLAVAVAIAMCRVLLAILSLRGHCTH